MESVGADVAERRTTSETFGAEHAWDWNLDASGRRVAYVGPDMTGVPQQGLSGEKLECRGSAWCSTRSHPVGNGSAESGRRITWRRLMSLEEIGQQLRALYKSEPKLWKTYWNRAMAP